MKYSSKEEAQAAAMKRRNEWNKRNYRKLTVDIPIELAERLEEAASSAGESKRNIVILALERHLKRGKYGYTYFTVERFLRGKFVCSKPHEDIRDALNEYIELEKRHRGRRAKELRLVKNTEKGGKLVNVVVMSNKDNI